MFTSAWTHGETAMQKRFKNQFANTNEFCLNSIASPTPAFLLTALRRCWLSGKGLGLSGKISGAGGGDNLFFFYANPSQKEALLSRLPKEYPLIQSLIEGVRP
ncbi:MAG: hypothetical protein MZU97_19645 [Bacillus subtilis]|nr:hypothetical protein [Bacillus subtilis]